MPKDLRSFIAELESKYPEEVARVIEPDLAALRNHGAADSVGKAANVFRCFFVRTSKAAKRQS